MQKNGLCQRGNALGLRAKALLLLAKTLLLLAKTLRQGEKVLCLLVNARCPRNEFLEHWAEVLRELRKIHRQ